MLNPTHFHPISVHFPVALLIIAFLFEVLALIYKSNKVFTIVSFYLFIAGSLGAIVAVITGNLFTEELTGPAHDVMESHHLFANITMYLAIVTSLFRVYLMAEKKEDTTLKWISFSAMFITMVAVGLTGYFGGSLVYDFMIKM